MSVNIFGEGPITTATTIIRQGLPGIGFKYLDEDGNFDIEDKRLANVANPQEEKDVTTKIYTDNLVTEVRSKVDETLKHTGNISKSIIDLRKICVKDEEFKKTIETINESLIKLEIGLETLNNKGEEYENKLKNIKGFKDVENFNNKMEESETKLNTVKKDIAELKSEDDHIKKFVEEMKAQLFDLHNNVLTKEGFEAALETINKQISILDKNMSTNKHKLQINREICAYETIIFQTNSKLESGKFPFVLGMKGGASMKTGYVMPYDGFIDTIILSSQDLNQHIAVKLLINGNEYPIALDKYKDEFFSKIRVTHLHLNEGDVIQIQANVDTNDIKMHVVQVFVGYNLVDKNMMLKDQPIEDEEEVIEFNDNESKNDKNIYELHPPAKINSDMIREFRNRFI